MSKILAQNNITAGLPDGTFGPDVKVTREQFAAFLARVLEPSFRPALPKPKGELEVHYIDVGQGDATLLNLQVAKQSLLMVVTTEKVK